MTSGVVCPHLSTNYPRGPEVSCVFRFCVVTYIQLIQRHFNSHPALDFQVSMLLEHYQNTSFQFSLLRNFSAKSPNRFINYCIPLFWH